MGAGEVDQHTLNRLPGHTLGLMHGMADRDGRGLHVHNGTSLYAGRGMVTNANDADMARLLDPGDKATDLGRADVKGRDDAASRALAVSVLGRADAGVTHLSSFLLVGVGAGGIVHGLQAFLGIERLSDVRAWGFHDQTVVNSQIDADNVLVQQIMLIIHPHEPVKRLARGFFG